MRRIKQRNFANIDFHDLQRAVEHYGFTLARVNGSHHIYRHPIHSRELNLQPAKDGTAKPYQVRQFLQTVERYTIIPEADDDP